MYAIPTFGLGVIASPTEYINDFPQVTQDTEVNIYASSPSSPSDQAPVVFGTDTKDFYIYYNDAWFKFSDDGTDFDTSLTFPSIEVFDNESEFIGLDTAPDYTIVHAKDTDRLYVWDGSAWYFYNQN
jgi:hypothetical protein